MDWNTTCLKAERVAAIHPAAFSALTPACDGDNGEKRASVSGIREGTADKDPHSTSMIVQ